MSEKKQKRGSKVEIVDFNDMVDFEKEQVKKLTVEESTEIRKKLMFLLFGMFIVGFIIIAFMYIFDGSGKNEENRKDSVEQTNEEKVNIPDGVVDIANEQITKYRNLLVTNYYDILYYPSLKEMFGTANANDLNNNNKLYFASKSETFQNYINNAGISYHQYQCVGSGTIEIDASIIKEAMVEVFGKDVVYKTTDFYYLHYAGDSLINVYRLKFLNGKYTMTCLDKYDTNIKMIMQSKIEEVRHESERLIFSKRVVFVTKNGVYADPYGKKLITNNKNDAYNSYIKKGQLYKFVFTKNGDNYYFTNIQK